MAELDKQESPVVLMNGKYGIYHFQSEVGFVPPAQNYDQVSSFMFTVVCNSYI